MRHIFFSFLLLFWLICAPRNTLAAEYKPESSQSQNSALLSASKSFYKSASLLVQQQINLIARIEQALFQPDANRMRSVRGQLTIQVKAVESFIKYQYNSPKALCTPADYSTKLPLPEQLTESQTQIYCSLYASSSELSKLAPLLDRLLSRRGELALVRELPLVSGERQSDPVLSIVLTQHPNLGKQAIPFSTWEPIPPSPPLLIGRTAKTAIADYVPPRQPAIAPPAEALTTIETAKQLLTTAQAAFPPDIKFNDPRQTLTKLDRFAYDLDPQEPQTYAKFLTSPNTGIFRVLPHTAYDRPLNTLQNRLQAQASDRYPFPSLGEAKGGFTPSLALVMVGDNFQLKQQELDYNFMVDVGDIPLEKLDTSLKNISPQTREFFLSYQPPKQLKALQVEQRRFLSGKNQNLNHQVILAGAKAELNRTYLVRSLQFQLPEMIISGQPLTPTQRRHLDQLQQMHSSDMIFAFRPVRRRSDGSYTVLWRVLNQLPAPQIEDLENYVKY
jgi:hypothetical protein